MTRLTSGESARASAGFRCPQGPLWCHPNSCTADPAMPAAVWGRPRGSGLRAGRLAWYAALTTGRDQWDARRASRAATRSTQLITSGDDPPAAEGQGGGVVIRGILVVTNGYQWVLEVHSINYPVSGRLIMFAVGRYLVSGWVVIVLRPDRWIF